MIAHVTDLGKNNKNYISTFLCISITMPQIYIFFILVKNPFLESRDDYVTVDDFELSQKHIQLKQDRFFNRIKKSLNMDSGIDMNCLYNLS